MKMSIENALDSIGIKTAISTGNYAYLLVPANSLRGFFDNLFPVFAKNTTADVARGFGHRWVAGHDLLIDVPKTMSKQGIREATNHAGHILLTDFPTKAGIPIPGLSSSGLGNFLVETCKIPRGYLCLNVMDATVGIFAMTEGTFDLFNVIAGQLRMSPRLFFDTFVEGAAEIAFGMSCENPLLLIAGIEQVSAGIVSTFYTITHPLWYINPLDFFSGCLSAGLLSFIISKFVLKKDTLSASKDAAKSCVVGGLFSISISFGFGGVLALMGCGLGKLMAERDNKDQRLYFVISEEEIKRLKNSFNQLFGPDFQEGWFFEEYNNEDFCHSYLPEFAEVSLSSLILSNDCSSYYNLFGLPEGTEQTSFFLDDLTGQEE